MRVLFDTDVVLDLVLDRTPFVEAAAALWELHRLKSFETYVTPVTLVNVFYITRKLKTGDIARQAVAKLLAALHVCPVDATVLRDALAASFGDYEDGVQHAAAVAHNLDAIVTRNGDDYRAAALPVYAPADLLK